MHEDTPALLSTIQRHAAEWFASLGSRTVRASLTTDQLRQQLGGPLPDQGTDPEALTNLLATAGTQGTVATAGPRYFGFVVGGTLPAALAADWLVSAWDQNAGVYVMSPLVSVIEQITGAWLRDLAGLPSIMSFGSSPAARWPTSPASPLPVIASSPTPVGTSKPTASSALHPSKS